MDWTLITDALIWVYADWFMVWLVLLVVAFVSVSLFIVFLYLFRNMLGRW